MSSVNSPDLVSPTSAVYLSYDVDKPPPHPGHGWTRFICISDTHSEVYPVPPGDVLLHSGDLSSRGSLRKLQVTFDWLKTLPHSVKIVIAGNHDLCLDEQWREGGEWHRSTGHKIPSKDVTAAMALVRSKAVRDKNIHYLQHESIVIQSPSGRQWEIYGSPAALRYSQGAFQYIQGEGEAIHALIPATTDILLTHGPPYGICDRTRRGKHAGCKSLHARLNADDLRRCRLHVFGHIHEAHGAVMSKGSGRISVNAALHSGGQAVIVDLKDK